MFLPAVCFDLFSTNRVAIFVVAGDPSPQVNWWKENVLVDQTYESTYSHVVQNTVKIGPLTRSDLGTVLTCLSSNNNISVPVSSKVSIYMVFPPVDVSLMAVGQPLSAGLVYILSHGG